MSSEKPVDFFFRIQICLFAFLFILLFTPNGQQIFSKFQELPLASIKSAGWLKQKLETERNGLIGHLECAKYPFYKIWWGADTTTGNKNVEQWKWWPYEQSAYWIDGMTRAGYCFVVCEIYKKFEGELKFKNIDVGIAKTFTLIKFNMSVSGNNITKITLSTPKLKSIEKLYGENF